MRSVLSRFVLVGLVHGGFAARACEVGLANEVLVSFTETSLVHAGFARIGASRFYGRGAFVLEDLGRHRGRIWQSEFDRIPVSSKMKLLIPGELGRDALSARFASSGFMREGEDVWKRTFSWRDHVVTVVGLIDARGHALVVAPATLRPDQVVLANDLRLDDRAFDSPTRLGLENSQLHFTLGPNGFASDVVCTADLARLSIDDPLFLRPPPNTKMKNRVLNAVVPVGKRAHCESFAKMALLRARNFLGPRIRIGELVLPVVRNDRPDVHRSRFDDFEVNSGTMLLVHPVTARMLSLNYLTAYEAFVYGDLGDPDLPQGLDSATLAKFWTQ